ncbi:Tim10/DDP family zinc finger [Seminavis robusta]|uniref:Mitochondrial import inner membrane translocase subunit n=1 Tax=Seminavis robusta TaxID=568900 RepID=A0A9N8HIQ0_9STRA|nr:Tim10/DDP family zinc finger [Seminavis robusta]|eukprot:Sro609_g174940.1 Tim10/DDP family zinc finger (82) ;mRNA; r:9738-10226
MDKLTPEQQQQVMQQAAMAANQQVMQDMMKQTINLCFKKCAGTSGDRLDRKEQACMGYCQDLYLETRAQVQAALQDRQQKM